MTAYGQILSGKVSRRANKKDGAPRPSRAYANSLEAAGFVYIGEKRWAYTWEGYFPKFTMAPGANLNGKIGLIARCKDVVILFPYGADPDFIKTRLDDEILAIMGLQADVADPVASDFIPFLGEPVVIVEGQEVGPEINFDAWMVAGA